MVYGLVVTTLPIPNTPVYISCTSYKCTCIGGCILLYIYTYSDVIMCIIPYTVTVVHNNGYPY